MKLPLRNYYRGGGNRGYNVADTLLLREMFLRLPVCLRHKICARDRNISDFCHKHFVSATNVSTFAQRRNETFVMCPARLLTQETSWATMCPQQCVLVCHHLYKEISPQRGRGGGCLIELSWDFQISANLSRQVTSSQSQHAQMM